MSHKKAQNASRLWSIKVIAGLMMLLAGVSAWAQNRGGHPVLVDLSFKQELLSLSSNRGLKALFEAHPEALKRVPVDSPYIARDMDTWDEYQALHKEVTGEPAPQQR